MPDDKRDYGSGSLRLRGKKWWVRYYGPDGTRIEESSKETSITKARKFLNDRIRQVTNGEFPKTDSDPLTFADLERMLIDYYHAKRSKSRAERAIANVRKHLGLYTVKNITTDVLWGYVKARREDGKAEATIRYELAMLKKAMNLALEAEKLDRAPKFPKLTVENAREGFFEREQLDAVLKELPEHHRGWALFAYHTGWRARSEILGIEAGYEPLLWENVDFDAGVVRIPRTKNLDARTFPFAALPELKELLEHQRDYTKHWEAVRGREVPWVFSRRGHRIRDYYSAWRAACERAKLPTKIVHDFRRSAVRNLERAGVPRKTAMELVGHKTESVYRRYDIVDEDDLRAGVKRLAAATSVRSEKSD